MSCCHHIHWLLQREAEGEQFYVVRIKLLLRPDRPSFAQENNHALLFLQNYTCLLQTGYCYIFTYLGVVGEALINDSYSEQQLFKFISLMTISHVFIPRHSLLSLQLRW